MKQRRRRVLAVVVLGLLAVQIGQAVPAAAQEQQEVRSGRVDVHAADGRELTLDVTLPRDLWGTDLPASAFRVREDEAERPAEVRRLRGDDLEVMLVVDPGLRQRGLAVVAAALREFVLGLPRRARVGLVAASEDPQVLVEPTRSRRDLLAPLERLTSGERSVLSGIEVALGRFTEGPEVRRTLVVVRVPGGDRDRDRVEAVGERMEAARVALYEVEVQQTYLGSAPPARLSLPTGTGRAAAVATVGQVLPRLDAVAFGLANQYRLTTRFEGSGAVGTFVEIGEGGAVREVATLVGLPRAVVPPPAAPSRSVMPELLVLAGAAGLLVLVVLVPPRLARRRQSRSAPPPLGPPLRPNGVGTSSPAPAPPSPVARRRGPPALLGGEQVEGPVAVGELLRARRRRVHELWLGDDGDPDVLAELVALARERRVTVREVAAEELSRAIRSPEPGGVLAHAAPLPVPTLEELAGAGDRPGRLLGVDGTLEDEQLGRLVAAARAVGATGVVLVRGRRSPVTPVALRVAEGSFEHVPVTLVPSLAFAAAALRAAGVAVLGHDDGAGPLLESPALADGPVAVLLPDDRQLGHQVLHRCDAVAAVGGPHASLLERVEIAGTAFGPIRPVSGRSASAGR